MAVPGHFNLFPHLTVLENLLFSTALGAQVPKREALAHRYGNTWSG